MEAMDSRESRESLFDEMEEGGVRAFTLYSCNEIEEIEEKEKEEEEEEGGGEGGGGGGEGEGEKEKNNDSLQLKPISRLKRLPDGRLSLENTESDIEEMIAREFFLNKQDDDDHKEAPDGFFYRTLDRVNEVLETETAKRVITVLGTLATAFLILNLWPS